MPLQMENPALMTRGFPNTDLPGGWINSEDSPSIRPLQVSLLTRRYAISAAMAAVVAPLVFGVGQL